MPKQHEPAVRNTEIYSSRTTFQHIDDFLGNSQSRFFGNGYKLTNPLLKETLLSETTDGILSLESIRQLQVSAGQDWSKKANEVQRPHLSTVDAIVLIAKCLYSALSDEASQNSTRNRLGKIDVRQLEILSGKEPLEYDSHSNFPVLLQLDRSAPHPNFSGTIGNFSYRGKLTTGFQDLDSPVGEYNRPSPSSSLGIN
jgi:putative uncharacterized protein mmyD